MREVVLVDGMRTPFGKMDGTLKDIAGSDLTAMTVKALVAKTGILEKGGKVDSVICGSASGARIGFFCVKELARSGGLYGLFSSCCGGGQGVTTLIENLRR